MTEEYKEGDKVMCDIFDGVEPFETEIVTMTCLDCGESFTGIKERVAHIIAQHNIIHEGERLRAHMEVRSLSPIELREDFEVCITHLATAFQSSDFEVRQAIHIALKSVMFKQLGVYTRQEETR